MAEIGLAAATLAELGVEAMLAGDVARAVGAFGAIPEDSWQALRQRFPGFPNQLDRGIDTQALTTAVVVAIESAPQSGAG